MQVKIFEAEDMATGLRMVKDELGPDALIISTRTVKNSKLGLLGKSTLEITAAIDNFPTNSIHKPLAKKHHPYQATSTTSSSQRINYYVDDQIELSASADSSAPRPRTFSHQYADAGTPQPSAPEPPRQPQWPRAQTRSVAASAFSSPSLENKNIMGEVEDLKNLVRSLAGEVARLQPGNVPLAAKGNSMLASLPQGDNMVSELLAKNGINPEISEIISQFIYNNFTNEDLSDPDNLKRYIVQSIQSMIEVTPPFHSDEKQQRIAFVGPTGVGKTTTLAKLAAAQLSAGSHSVALITIDTYRIAAVEQLKVYGEIMNLPVDVVITPDQLERALLKHRDRDFILIDTAGRSPKDGFSIDELSTFLRPELNIEKHLVLSATTRESELIDTIERFSTLDIHGTIYTKIDECSQLGALLNVQIQNSKPISCLTNGQRVPEDMLEISPQRIAELIMSTN